MKRLLLPLLAALALPTTVNANEAVDNWFDNEWWRRDFEKSLKIPASEITDQNIDEGRIGSCSVFIENNFPEILVGDKKMIIRESCKDLYRKYKNTLNFPEYYINYFDKEITQEKCLNAKDYIGCMQYESANEESNPFGKKLKQTNCDMRWCDPNEFVGNDNLGRPVLKGWYFKDAPQMRASMQIDPKIYQVEVDNQFGRYIHKRSLFRYYRQARAGTSGYTQTYGGSQTNCTGFGNSISCTTTPPVTTYIPGIPSRPGGVDEVLENYIFDCQDKLYAKYEGERSIKIENINGKMKRWVSFKDARNNQLENSAIEFCNEKSNVDIQKLPISTFIKYKNKTIRGKPKIRGKSNLTSNINCDSPVWKDKPRCN